MASLAELLDQVNDRDSFFAFVQALIEDRRSPRGPRAHGWENGTIEDYLDGALRWAIDSEMGQSQGVPQAPSWRMFAEFLQSGKFYE